jgi:hypothetical protein
VPFQQGRDEVKSSIDRVEMTDGAGGRQIAGHVDWELLVVVICGCSTGGRSVTLLLSLVSFLVCGGFVLVWLNTNHSQPI